MPFTIYKGETFTHFTKNEGLSGNLIGYILEDRHGNRWIGTYYTAVMMYNGQTFAHFTPNEGLSGRTVYSILEDSHDNLWFSSWGKGVCMYNGKTFTHFTTEQGLSDNKVVSMLEDRQGNLWFGSSVNGGVCMYDGETFMHFTQREGLMSSGIMSILEDSHGNLWFAGGPGVSMYDGKTFTHYTEKEGLLGRGIVSILEDSQGNLWIGGNRGVSMFNGESFTHFTENEGLSSNEVVSILEDRHNDIWVGTRNGLNRLVIGPEGDTGTEENLSAHGPVIQSFEMQDGLKGPEFTQNAALVDSKNNLWWGHRKGLTMLDVNNLKIPESPAIQLNQIDINGQFKDYLHLAGNDKKNIEFNKVPRFSNYPLNLELPNTHNHLTFHFSAIDWSALHKIKYSDIMEGLDDRWNLPTTEASAEYRNLPQGRYTFKVRAIGAAQKWSETFEYTFRISPPLWLSWWAYVIYGFILLLLIRWYRESLIKREKIKADLKIKEVEVSTMQELDQMKSRFFANISHEFRTPLTLIQGPIEKLERELPDLTVEKTRELLRFMKRNTQRLKHLINQILDISKLDTGKVTLQVSEGNLEQFVRTIILSFLSLAESKKIKYTYDLPETSGIVLFDSDKLDKIFTNLISNIFKFTPKGGNIRVGFKYITSSVDNTQMYAIIEVTDTGRGIPREKLDRLFDRFYQVSDSDSRDAEGIGLGLALTKELVDQYRGEISVDSQEDKGSIFTVKLPVSKALFTEEERIAHPAYQEIKPEQSGPFQDQKQLDDIDRWE